MKPKTWNRWPLLGLAATAVVLAAPPDAPLAAAQAAAETAGTVEPQAPKRPALPTESQANRVELERLRRTGPQPAADKPDVANAFNPVSWYEPPPPPPPPPPAPPPTPVAPPVPFTYFGRYEDPPTQIVMLAKNDQVYTVSEGDVIDDTYRVARIADGSIALVYLPLNTNQTISMGVQ